MGGAAAAVTCAPQARKHILGCVNKQKRGSSTSDAISMSNHDLSRSVSDFHDCF